MAKLQEILRKLAQELDDAEREEREADTDKDRKEAREEIEALKKEIAELKATSPSPAPEPPAPEPAQEPPPAPEPPAPPKAKTRPGRKSGQLYDLWPDDETGQLVKLDVPRVYTGEDEPAEVEIPEAAAS